MGHLVDQVLFCQLSGTERHSIGYVVVKRWYRVAVGINQIRINDYLGAKQHVDRVLGVLTDKVSLAVLSHIIYSIEQTPICNRFFGCVRQLSLLHLRILGCSTLDRAFFVNLWQCGGFLLGSSGIQRGFDFCLRPAFEGFRCTNITRIFVHFFCCITTLIGNVKGVLC